MTRTFVVGEISEQVRSMESLVLEAIERAREAVAPGITGRELHDLVCDMFEPAGYRTQRNGPGEDPNEGFQFSLGHGVGLAVTSLRVSAGRATTRWSPETSSRSSQAYGCARSARSGSRTCSS